MEEFNTNDSSKDNTPGVELGHYGNIKEKDQQF